MRLTTSFSASPKRLVPYLGGAAWGMALLTVVAMALLVHDANQSQAELDGIRNTLARLRAHHAEPPAPPVLVSAAQLALLKQNVARLNRLPGYGARPLLQLLDSIEASLPPDAALLELHYAQGNDVVLLKAEAGQAETLAGFLRALTERPEFAQALLVQRSERRSEGERIVQFEVRLTRRSK